MILCFMAFLAWAMVGTIMGSDKVYSYYENRLLDKMPSFTVNSVMNGMYFKRLENFLIDHAAERKRLVFAETELDLDFFKRPVVNDVVVKDNLLLSYCSYDKKSTKELKREVKDITANLRAVSKAAEAYGGYFSYVAVPPQFYCYADEYPWYLENWDTYTQKRISLLSESLEKEGVDFLDAGPIIEKSAPLHSQSSRVDNHYSIYGAFNTYKAVMEHLNDISGKDMDILTDEDVTITQVPNAYLGSYERKILGLRNIRESLYRLDLKEPLEYTYMIDGIGEIPSVYVDPEKKNKRVTYNYYMGGDQGETFTDTNRPRLPSILIYGDSFTNALECILFNSFNRMYSLDLRHYKGGTICDFIKKYKPDYVICVRDYEALIDTDANGGR